MKRTSLLVTFFLCCLLVSHAQLRVAIVGGGHQSKVIEENDLPNWTDIKSNFKGRTGVHLGFLADLPFGQKSNFYFQPGIIFNAKGRKYSETRDTTISQIYTINSSEYINYIAMPLNLVYKIKLGGKTKFILGAGPYVSFFYTGKLKTETLSKDLEYSIEENDDPEVGDGPDKYKTFDYGVNGLAGFEFGRVFLTANYSRGLSNFFQPAGYTATDYKHQLIGATLGIFLGKPVKLEPKDSDKDGVPDTKDKCPQLAGLLELNGCPDTDKDGIADPEDGCPTKAGPTENKGCPYTDKDSDGILDKDDKCPTVPGPKDNAGCPYPDADKDGLADKDDKCPQVPGLARYEGCPIPDSDGDGVNDENDKCPTVKGLVEKDGCPEEIKQEIVKKVDYAAKKIQFRVNSAILLSSSYQVLNDVVTILQNNPEIKVLIGGHTSSEGTAEVNRRISNERANSVKAYFISKGVDPARLNAVGYGPDQPLNTGKTEAERAKNRRVELDLSNQ